MTQKEAPKIEFPCANYPIKVVGVAVENYDQIVLDIIRQHAPEVSSKNLKARDSSKANFRSVTVFITATGIDQLQKIHQDLSANPNVRMVI